MTVQENLEKGTLGFFWVVGENIPDLDKVDPERGHATLEGPLAILDVLDETTLSPTTFPWGGPERPEPAALIAVTPEDAVLFLEAFRSRTTRRFGGAARASSKQYVARTAIGGAPVERLRSTFLRALHASFLGIDRWAGMSGTKEMWKQGKDGRLEEWSVVLTVGDSERHRLTAGRTIEMSTTWRVDGPHDRRTVSAPVTIGCEAQEPVDVWTLLQPLLRAQDLLSLAFEGFVAADGGTAQLDLLSSADAREQRPSLWNGVLMARPPGAASPRSMDEFPLFSLETIGGLPGLASWIRIAVEHPRATRPIVAPYREGLRSAAVSLLDMAAAIEYWVKANRQATWAATAVSKKRWVQAVAEQCGRPFTTWVGKPEAWSRAFWGAYNHLKHDPSQEPDATDLADLAESARYMLAAAILNRVAGNKGPSKTIFTHPRLNGLGRRLHDRFALWVQP